MKYRVDSRTALSVGGAPALCSTSCWTVTGIPHGAHSQLNWLDSRGACAWATLLLTPRTKPWPRPSSVGHGVA